MTIYGYARVSTEGQDLAAQLSALTVAGAVKVFAEKESGARADRPQLARLLKALEPGDVVLVCKIDRLARSTRDFLNTIADIEKAGAGFRSLGEPAIDTAGGPYAKVLVTILAAFAELERSIIVGRTTEGRKRAQARGVRFGRKLKLTPHQRQEALARRQAGETLTDIGRSFNVSYMTISRVVEVEGLRATAHWLDAQVTKLRAQRDQLAQEALAR